MPDTPPLPPMTRLAVTLAQARSDQPPGLTPLPDVPSPFAAVNTPPTLPTQGEYRVPIADTRRGITARQRLSAQAPSSVVETIINTAKAKGVDPYTALAIAYQESGLGERDPENPMRVRTDLHPVDDPTPANMIAKGIDILAQNLHRYAGQPEARQLQAYNGLGMLRKLDDSASSIAYGLPLPIDTRRNPVYGNRVIDLREHVIKTNPGLMALIQSMGGR